jgi:hypothetical protein
MMYLVEFKAVIIVKTIVMHIYGNTYYIMTPT